MRDSLRMPGRAGMVAGLLVLTTLAAPPAGAQEVHEGRTAGGAHYRIQVPPLWNGKLVIWNHGFDLAEPGPVEDMGPLAELQLLEGYAVAASSYRLAGWALFRSLRDLRALLRAFEAEVGEPEELIVYGASLGGLVTLAAVEQGIGMPVAGAGLLCSPSAGSRNWDGALDLRLVYDAVCAGVPGAAIPGGADGLPPGSELETADILERVDACTGIDTRPRDRSRAQRRRLGRILDATGLPEEFLATDMGYVTFGLRDLITDRRKLRGRNGLTNVGVEYDDPGIDATIERHRAHRGARRRLQRNYTPDGEVGATKILAIHTDRDGLVLVENAGEYAELVPASQLTTAIVVEEEPSHCGFTVAEGIATWQALTRWIDTDEQPGAGGLQQDCRLLATLGLAEGPCRFDPDYRIPDMDGRIPPR